MSAREKVAAACSRLPLRPPGHRRLKPLIGQGHVLSFSVLGVSLLSRLCMLPVVATWRAA